MACSHASEQVKHLAAIDAIVARWQAGEISLARKRELIAEENDFYHGHPARRRLRKLVSVAAERDVPWWHDA